MALVTAKDLIGHLQTIPENCEIESNAVGNLLFWNPATGRYDGWIEIKLERGGAVEYFEYEEATNE